MTKDTKQQNEGITPQQRKALHLMFGMWADELNAGGLDMRMLLKPEIDIPWTTETIKEYLWRPVQRKAVDKESTNDLNTDDINKMMDIMNRYFAESIGMTVEFPSYEQIIAKLEAERAGKLKAKDKKTDE